MVRAIAVAASVLMKIDDATLKGRGAMQRKAKARLLWAQISTSPKVKVLSLKAGAKQYD